MMSSKFVRDAQGPWKTVVRGLWVWEQQTWESQPRGTKVGTSHSGGPGISVLCAGFSGC